jgi:hypothetical protein
MTLSCTKCGNSLHVETVETDPPTAGWRCRCPRCNNWFAVPGGDAGEPKPDPTGWAIRAEPTA